jgi:tetratricopeptide (TPR) repeat protein
MNKNDFSHGVASIFRKTIIVLSGLILSLVILEAGLRLGGFVLLSLQEYGNLQSIKQKGAYRILCLGESTTQGAYPKPLEQVLNQRNIGIRFTVIDKGKAGTSTPEIVGHVESDLDEYRPNMVIAMMGINEKGVRYYEDIPESDTWLFRHCRVYKFCRMLYMNLLKKLWKKDIYGLGRSDSERKAKSEDAWTVAEKTTFANEIPAEGIARSDSESEKGSSGSNRKFSETEKPFKAIAFDPQTYNACVGLGQTLYRDGNFSGAEASFKKAIELDPKNDWAYLKLGQLYRFQDKLSRAEDFYRKAIELNPENDNACFGLGWVYIDQGKLPQARDLFKKAAELNPENDNNQYVLGDFYLRQGKFPQAEDCFKKAIEINPTYTYYFLALGGLYRKQGKFPQAEELFKKAVELNPKHDWAVRALSSLYEEMEKPELAKEYTQKVNPLGFEALSAVTVNHYRKLKEILDKKGIKLVCMQYPMRSVEPLKKIFGKDEGVIFVDNESIFREAVKRSGYKEYFQDMFAGDFGHCTQKGNELLAQNIADVILREVFNK